MPGLLCREELCLTVVAGGQEGSDWPRVGSATCSGSPPPPAGESQCNRCCIGNLYVPGHYQQTRMYALHAIRPM